MRAIDWIDFTVFIVPTLVMEQLEITLSSSSAAMKALISLVTACSIALLYEITDEDINLLER